jgi:hypothetical protein
MNVERRASAVVMACSKETGGSSPVESDTKGAGTNPVPARSRLPYPICLAMQSGNEDSLREAVRLLVEGAV